MRVVGLTGGVACGKSTVGRLLTTEHGVPVVDADQMAREVVRPGTRGLEAIRERFGDAVLTPSGELDRSALRARIVRDADARRDLEAITHPLIRQAIGEQLIHLAGAGHDLAFVEAALLVETGGYRLYDGLWVVSCSPDLQRDRLMQRDGASEADARALIAAQAPMAQKEAVATRILRNDGDTESLRARVTEAVRAERAEG
jgi:dephospho-CoA kinase